MVDTDQAFAPDDFTPGGAALDLAAASAVVQVALTEDLGGDPGRDVTTQPTISAQQVRHGNVIARQDGVVAGLAVIELTLSAVAHRLGLPQPSVEVVVRDGQHVSKGDVLATISGPTHVLLIAERTLLNIVCRMSGVATHTRAWVKELVGTSALVLDTRKTTPGMRALEKYAVRCGGGTNKRMGLYDVAMIKDNHKIAAGSITAAYEQVHAAFPDVDIQVEVTTTAEAVEAVAAGARFLLCDNMTPPQLTDAVAAARAATTDVMEIEATGGLTLAVAREYALTGVDYMSVGGLTHSSPIMDIAIDLAPVAD